MELELTAAQRAVQTLARDFAQGRVAPLAREMDERGEMPAALVGEMGALGLLGGPLPPEYGGQGWDPLALALCYEELGRADSSVRGFMTVHTSLVAQCILAWGTPEQKESYIPRLAHGDWIGCYCLTEPNAGSDAASIETTAIEDSAGYRLSGEKIWITNGGIAQLGIVFATRDRAARHRGICAFLVEMDAAGIRREKMPGRELATGLLTTPSCTLPICGCPRPRCWALPATASKWRCRPWTVAGWVWPRAPWAWGKPAWTPAWPLPRAVVNSAAGSATSKWCRPCWPIWPPTSKPRAGWCTTPPGSRARAARRRGRPLSPSCLQPKPRAAPHLRPCCCTAGAATRTNTRWNATTETSKVCRFTRAPATSNAS